MATERHHEDEPRPPYATRYRRAGTQAAIDLICRRQRHLIRDLQCLEAGLSARGVRHRLVSQRLFRIYPGVLALHPPPYTLRQRWLAATYACGPGSLISDVTSAEAAGLTDERCGSIHITNTTGRGRSIPAITVHRRTVDSRDVAARGGIPCTSVARTILDCAASLDGQALEEVLMAADSKRVLNRRRLDELIAEHRGRRGVRTLTALISDDPVDVRNRNELRMLRICRRAGVEKPRTNYPIQVGDRTFYADFCWTSLALIVEADSWRWHGGRQASESDADRDQLLATARWRVVHFTHDQIKHQAAEVGLRVAALTLTSAEQARRLA